MKTHKNVWEVNFDCLAGPTHHFGGLSLGNIASTSSKWRLSNPKDAALQGLEKMRFLSKKGFKQCILPPHQRPHYPTLRLLGFPCDNPLKLRSVYEHMPEIFSSVNSSSFMWAANAATVAPHFDAQDNKTHITPANLVTMFHRKLEASFTTKVLKKIFYDDNFFLVHDPLPAHDLFSDEGAANHNRLVKSHDQRGIEIFVYGKLSSIYTEPTHNYPARQSSLASAAIARLHRLDPEHVFVIEQNPIAIDSGAFHNDVVSVMHKNVILCHEQAFVNQKEVLKQIKERYQRFYNEEPVILNVSEDELSLKNAVSSYLFNSQLLSLDNEKMLLFAPSDSLHNEQAQTVIKRLISEQNPIGEVEYFDISESMANGGGPACLRLRVVLDEEEFNNIEQGVIFTEDLYHKIKKIIERYYVDRLKVEDFFDQQFLSNAKTALDEIASALNLGSIYDF